MIITYEGKQYPFSLDDIDIQQALQIEKYMGCSFAEWGKRLQDGDDTRARLVLGWLILHPDGDIPIGDTRFKMVRLAEAIEKAYAAEAAAAKAAEGPVPTGAASNGRKSTPASSPAT